MGLKELGAELSQDDSQTDMQAWLEMIESLRSAHGWIEDDWPAVEMVQTHISVVLLGRQYALKLKKPINFGFLDYTTLEKRRRACEAEVSLNRRLCSDIYLGVRPIIEVEGRSASFSGVGRVIDYGVLMKRLPAERMLDQLVAKWLVSESMIDRIAERLSVFHQDARRGPDVDVYGSLETIRRNWEENFAQTEPYIDRTIAQAAFDAVRHWVLKWLEDNEELLKTRVREGRICDGHGDVRCESICVTNGICIFDCIEFNERFRCGDIASEAAFLAMDLDARGRPDLGYYFTERYQTRVDDPQVFKLLAFYRCYRAFVRGKVLSFRLDEPEFSEEAKETATLRAKSYFNLAHRYATPLQRPTVIVISGLSGTGKSSVARAVASELGLRVVSSDEVRKSLLGEQEERPLGYGAGIYNDEANRLTYQTLIEKGSKVLNADGGVILDATFRRAADRVMAREMAEAADAEWRLIECHSSPELVRQRLELRTVRGDGFSDATWETYLRQGKEFEPADDSSGDVRLRLETNGKLSEISQAVTDWLRAHDVSS